MMLPLSKIVRPKRNGDQNDLQQLQLQVYSQSILLVLEIVRMGCPMCKAAQVSSSMCRDQNKTNKTLAEARRAIMAPLSAASLESYTRAYPFLVKLHMLQELADAAVLLQEASLAGTLERQRRLRWEERLNVTQSSLTVQVHSPCSKQGFPKSCI